MNVAPVQKARKRLPSWIDKPPPKPARDELAIAARFEQQFTRAFLKLSRALITPKTKKDLIRALGDPDKTIEDAINVLPWWDPNDPMSEKQWAMFSAGLEKAYENITQASGAAALKEIGIDSIEFTIKAEDPAIPIPQISVPPNPWTKEWIRSRVWDSNVQLNDQQKGLLREIIMDGVEQGMRTEEIADRIETVVGLTDREASAVVRRESLIFEKTGSAKAAKQGAKEYSAKLLKDRARRIARFETREALSQGQIDSWKMAQQNGALSQDVEKEWVSMPNSPRQSDICADPELDGQRRKLNEAFDTIIGPVMRPPAHVGCRSTMVLVFPEEE